TKQKQAANFACPSFQVSRFRWIQREVAATSSGNSCICVNLCFLARDETPLLKSPAIQQL
ncbi:MAG: hypothetical protein QF437_19920, partial [Planctomycetota bacterium]|nr:hypothetical protein [Planctomycetota bacterium]